MQVLRTLFWVLLAVVAVVFAVNNWTVVPVRLWAGLTAEIMLPALLAIVFLAGWLPTWLLLRASRWRMKSRLTASERQLAELRGPSAEPTPLPAPAPSGVPTAVPPGVA
ncbi:LapA family protein [Sphingomonas gilva]|uniref:LapA family protein n=1 Tax=Sphingomonas gilva TaxID=2305907 RepID=A0A396RL99_9SPHN|nr:LapA family protein [Sphingomonas gilva]RHW17088.1 LapA family protein [Sphingomonas gilva]